MENRRKKVDIFSIKSGVPEQGNKNWRRIYLKNNTRNLLEVKDSQLLSERTFQVLSIIL